MIREIFWLQKNATIKCSSKNFNVCRSWEWNYFSSLGHVMVINIYVYSHSQKVEESIIEKKILVEGKY